MSHALCCEHACGHAEQTWLIILTRGPSSMAYQLEHEAQLLVSEARHYLAQSKCCYNYHIYNYL